MDQLELFKFIDKVTSLLRSYKGLLNNIAQKIAGNIKKEFSKDEFFLNSTYRIKSENSLREKIIRNNFFIKYKNPENVILNLSDLIGIRIECRFIKDEEYFYNKMLEIFNEIDEDGYFFNKNYPNMKLNLSLKQPQIQKNGFEIYKIDGIYKYGKNVFHFELQIKSMVNLFWGEVEHRILYKNYNYMIIGDFFKDIMYLIRDNLLMIDEQLRIIYDQVKNLDSGKLILAKTQLKTLLSKILHDVCNGELMRRYGFVLNFKKESDEIVEFLYMKYAKDNELSFGKEFIKLINKINSISENKIDFECKIEFEREIKVSDFFAREVGNIILKIINYDFKWNIFFKVIFKLAEDENMNSFEGFLYYLRYSYSIKFFPLEKIFNSEKDLIDIENDILRFVIDLFKINNDIKFILIDAPNIIEKQIINFIEYDKNISYYDFVNKIKDKLKDKSLI